MRVMDIVGGTSVDGPGLRTSIYFAGCTHHCPGCHNPESWDAAAGRDMTIDEIVAEVIENDFDVTFTGGDPMFQCSELLELAKRINTLGKTIWCYTGYSYESVAADSRMSALLPYIEVLVDGRFMEDLRDVKLLFRGSSNQRLIDVKKSTRDTPVIWDVSF